MVDDPRDDEPGREPPAGDRPPSNPPLGEIVGTSRLTIVERIAKGGMGAVYRAMQHGAEGFAKSVAVKTIIEPYSRSEEFGQMFIGEAKLVADLVHQNIAQVYQLGRDRDVLYIVMEYVEGINLQQFINGHRAGGRRIPVELAAYIASRVCRGLEYAHKKRGADGRLLGVVHRDISPTNVMITRLGEIKILDFGIAKARNLMDQREGDIVMGKRSYIAPEQAEMKPTDQRSDIFATGLVLWEMLAGLPPMVADGRPRKTSKLAGIPILPIARSVADLPPMLEAIVNKSTAVNPEGRYADAGQMGYDLEYFMYHKGYGPTIVTMERYLHKTFSQEPWADPVSAQEETLAETAVLDPPPDGES